LSLKSSQLKSRTKCSLLEEIRHRLAIRKKITNSLYVTRYERKNHCDLKMSNRYKLL